MTDLRVSPDADGLAGAVATALLDLLASLQAAGRTPQIALTGGTIAEVVHRETARRSPGSAVDWADVVVWWGDERFVPADSPDRNALAARRDLLDVVGAARVHEIGSVEVAADPDEAAAAYGELIRAEGGGRFDLVMLGLGPDGHVASLMPHHRELDVEDRIAVGVRDSPKPPPDRVSLTFPALNRTDRVWFLVSGEHKAEALARATAPDGDVHETPARGISAPEVVWYVDRAAASRL